MSSAVFATRDQFRRPAPRRFDEFDVPDFGRVRIRSTTEAERSGIEAKMCDKNGRNDPRKLRFFKALWLIACLVDADGNPLLADDDVEHVMQMDSSITAAIFDRCVKHCGISQEDVEDLGKN
jgi:hypothetical protein